MPPTETLALTLPATFPPTLTVRPPGPQAHTHTPLKLVEEQSPNTAKLSVLQRDILKVAYRWQCKGDTSICTADTKAEIFGWPVKLEYRTKDAETNESIVLDVTYMASPGTARFKAEHHCANQSVTIFRGQVFDLERISEQSYNTVCASISRAMRRLVDRGLMTKNRNGRTWSLTNTGTETVKQIPNAIT